MMTVNNIREEYADCSTHASDPGPKEYAEGGWGKHLRPKSHAKYH
jgi:hypothetical protein